ncbi:hypothetical protein EPN28_01235 [Patescibacteria group bacterium]|nr:MAG: hypothetical protein EPN28_01235 [Patescibacteria group bacterium]
MSESKPRRPEYEANVIEKLKGWIQQDSKALERAQESLVEFAYTNNKAERLARELGEPGEPTPEEIAEVLLNLARAKKALQTLKESAISHLIDAESIELAEVLREADELIDKIDADRKILAKSGGDWEKVAGFAKFDIAAAVKLLEKARAIKI